VGARANIILVNHGARRVFYTHWGAEDLPIDLFWGPERGVEFAESLEARDPDNLLGNAWAEGGAVVDLDRQVLLLFGGEFRIDVPLRRTYLKLASAVWLGWDVRWAAAGMFDLADHLGVPRDRVTSPPLTEPPPSRIPTAATTGPLDPPEEAGPTSTIISVHSADGALRFFGSANLFGLSWDVASILEDALTAPSHLRWGPRLVAFPSAGLHLDEVARHGFWWAADAAREPIATTEDSPGWTIDRVGDRFEAQLEATKGAIKFPGRTEQELVEEVRGLLFRTPADNAGLVLRVINAIKAQPGNDAAKANPLALENHHVNLSPKERDRVFADAMRRLA
jgi:hypothetical protein